MSNFSDDMKASTDQESLRARVAELEKDNDFLRVANETLHRSEHLFRQAVHVSPNLILLLDTEGTVQSANRTSRRQLGLSPHEITGRSIYSLVEAEHVETLRARITETMRGASVDGLELTLRRADSSSWSGLSRIYPLRETDGSIATCVLACTEVSQKTDLATALREAHSATEAGRAESEIATRMKDEFLANMSHELRTPLTTVIGLSEGLQTNVFGPLNIEQHVQIETIQASSQKLLELLNGLLDLSSLNSGDLALQRSDVDIPSLCRACLAQMMPSAQTRQQQLSLRIAPGVSSINADELRLKQILLHLLSNAVKFTKDGGVIALEASRDAENGGIRFTVSDSGVGIAAHQTEEIFRPFVQLEGGLDRKEEGCGMGLALARRLAQIHGGTIEVKSNPDVGSRFSVCLPAQSSPNDGDKVESPAEPQQKLVLIAEDNEANARFLSQLLTRRGYRVQVVGDGVEAVSAADDIAPDIILMDIQMPRMDGFEAMRRIRASRDTTHIPIIALTALAMHGDAERCLLAGANAYLPKPFRVPALLGAVKTALEPTNSPRAPH